LIAAARSFLYVPGDRPDRIAKALAGDADAVVIDLEDAVAQHQKAEARAATARVLQSPTPNPTWVRINGLDTGLAEDDVRAVASAHLTGVRIPKCESADQVRTVARWLRESAPCARIQCLIETAVGVENAFEIARSDPSVSSISLGETDLAIDLGVTDGQTMAWVRARVVVASRAVPSLNPPSQSVSTDLHDLAALERTTREAITEGFFGRSAIHPRQVPVINRCYAPDPEEVSEAQDVLRATVKTTAGAFVLPNGRFVDAAVVRRANAVLAAADRAAARETRHPRNDGP
jgi:citrate lyase subunit beta / citryl-CoA lyase